MALDPIAVRPDAYHTKHQTSGEPDPSALPAAAALHAQGLPGCPRHGLVVEAQDITGVDLRWGFDATFCVSIPLPDGTALDPERVRFDALAEAFGFRPPRHACTLVTAIVGGWTLSGNPRPRQSAQTGRLPFKQLRCRTKSALWLAYTNVQKQAPLTPHSQQIWRRACQDG